MATPGSVEAPYLGYSAHTFVSNLDSWYPGLGSPAQIVFPYYGAGAVVPVGVLGAKMYMTFPGTITLSALEVTPSGSMVLDILKNGSSICASARPTVVAGTAQINTTLTGWTVGFVAGDTLQVQVISVTTCTDFTLSLKALRVI